MEHDGDEDEAVHDGVEVGGELPQAAAPVGGGPAGVVRVPVDELRDELDVEHDVRDDHEGEHDVDNCDTTFYSKNGQKK